jgi:hypothetical protein
MYKIKPQRVYDKRFLFIGGLICVVTLCVLISFFIQLINIKKDDSTTIYGVDLISYYTAAKLIEEGETSEIYVETEDDFSVVNSGKFFETARREGFPLTPTRYVYLPLFLTPFTLLTRFDFSTAATVWLIINLMCVIAIIALECYFTGDVLHPFLRIMVITSLNLCSFPLFYALKLGQTSILIYLAVCLIYYFTMKNRDVPAGIFLGIITALKFSPSLFAIYFLYKKRYRLVISCMLTAFIIFLTSIAIHGLPLHKLYGHYLYKLSSMGIAAWSNQSIEAFLLRLFTGDTILQFAPIKIPVFFSIAKHAFTLSALGTLYLLLKKETILNQRRLYALEFSAVILCLLIIPSISWLHYFTLSTLSVVLITTVCFQTDLYREWIMVPLIITSYAMIAFHPNYDFLLATFNQGLFAKLLVSLPFIGTCIVLLADVLLLKKARRITISSSIPSGQSE